jgi:Short C-terminal domain
MPRRVGRRGVVGTMARTAAVVGTATAVSGKVQHSQMEKQAAAQNQQMANQAALESQAQLAELQAQMASQPAAPAESDLTTKLKELAELNAAGILTDEEFTAAKARLLA